jgi:O-antigen ligase
MTPSDALPPAVPVVDSAPHDSRHVSPSHAIRAWPDWLVASLCVLLVLTPVSNKLAGLAYIGLLLVALWAWWRVPRLDIAAIGPEQLGARFWLGVCLAAVVLRAAVSLRWGDSLGARHFEIRVLLAALAVYALRGRLFFSPRHRPWLMHALALALMGAFGIAFVHSRATPTNPIPWAASVSFLTCVLMALAMEGGSKWLRLSAVAGSFAGVGAVVLSQSRGSLGIIVWAGFLGALALYRAMHAVPQPDSLAARLKPKIWMPSVVLLSLLAVFFSMPRFYAEPAARMQAAWSDVARLSLASKNGAPPPEVVATSVGVRVYMWQMAINQIEQAPLLGYGRDQRIAWVQGLSKTSGTDVFGSLAHLHSDPLNALFEHGIIGLMSYLGMAVGLGWTAWRYAPAGSAMRLGLTGLVWMHLTSGLSNMNTGHNYYGVVLSLSIALVWLLSGMHLSKRRPQV